MKTKTILLIVIPLLFAGCRAGKESGRKSFRPEFRVQAGYNKGGVVENTDFSMLENTGVDACTGATYPGAHAGARVQLPVGATSLESGADIMINRQQLSFNDPVNDYIGERRITTSQLMLPLVFNIGMFRQTHDEGLLQLRLGWMWQLNYLSVSGDASLPAYDLMRSSNGPCMGFSTTPIRRDNGHKIGFYLDMYRGGQVYEDFYNQTDMESPGSSFFRLGVIYHFGNLKNNKS